MCCLEELFDKDSVCCKCNNDKLISSIEIQQIQAKLKSVKRKELDRLILIPKYKSVNDYLLTKHKRDEKYPKILQCAEKFQDINPSYINPVSQPTTLTIACPYCRSTNCKKISEFSKALSVGLFGIFALGKASKQWHCNNCNSDF